MLHSDRQDCSISSRLPYNILQKLLRVMRHCGLSAYVKLVLAEHFPCHARHHVLTVFERSDIMSDKVSHIKPAHMGHFQFNVRHVMHGLHIWRTLDLDLSDLEETPSLHEKHCLLTCKDLNTFFLEGYSSQNT